MIYLTTITTGAGETIRRPVIATNEHMARRAAYGISCHDDEADALEELVEHASSGEALNVELAPSVGVVSEWMPVERHEYDNDTAVVLTCAGARIAGERPENVFVVTTANVACIRGRADDAPTVTDGTGAVRNGGEELVARALASLVAGSVPLGARGPVRGASAAL